MSKSSPETAHPVQTVETGSSPDTPQPVQHGDKVRAGIAAARARGVDWGRAGRALAERNAERARLRAEVYRPLIVDLMSLGYRPGHMPRLFRKMGVPKEGPGLWQTVTITRIISRLGPSLTDDAMTVCKSGVADQIRAFIKAKGGYAAWRAWRGLESGL
jgi:hypothetical protein